jgi:hypothetical protein
MIDWPGDRKTIYSMHVHRVAWLDKPKKIQWTSRFRLYLATPWKSFELVIPKCMHFIFAGKMHAFSTPNVTSLSLVYACSTG